MLNGKYRLILLRILDKGSMPRFEFKYLPAGFPLGKNYFQYILGMKFILSIILILAK